jgi:outer membrane protein
MKKFFTVVGLFICTALCTGAAMAESIQNRVGVVGRIGFMLPADSDVGDFRANTDIGFVGGGGLIYGYNKNIALEFNVAYSWFGSERPSEIDTGEFSVTNYSLGAQYRLPDRFGKITPYGGAGLDILVNDYNRGNVDTVVGLHLSAGADYFILPNVAVNAELKVVLAPDADIKQGGVKTGNFDPTSFSTTFGVRYFFW